MKSKTFKYDGKSRPSNDLYKENFNRIFGVKTPYQELQEKLIKGDIRFGQMKRKKNNDKEK